MTYQKEIQEVVDMTGSPESAFKIFNDVVKHVFEWDEATGSGGCGQWAWPGSDINTNAIPDPVFQCCTLKKQDGF